MHEKHVHSGGELALLVRAAAEHYRRSYGVMVRPRSRAHVLLFVFIVVIVLLDAATTLVGMRTGVSEEANPYALAGMDAMGLEVYVAVASLLSLGLALPALVRPRGTVPATLFGCACAFLAAKAYIGLSNVLVLVS